MKFRAICLVAAICATLLALSLLVSFGQSNKADQAPELATPAPQTQILVIQVPERGAQPAALSTFDRFAQAGVLAGVQGVGRLAGKTIVVDAGHGGTDPGAIRNQVHEKDLTLSIALKLKALLEAEGATVILTRGDDSAIALPDRVQTSIGANADLFISVHINASVNSRQTGMETYYFTDNSEIVADTLQDSLENSFPEEYHREAVRRSYYVVRENSVPAVLLEVGYISNPRTRDRLKTSEYQQRLAEAIKAGIIQYFSPPPSVPKAGS